MMSKKEYKRAADYIQALRANQHPVEAMRVEKAFTIFFQGDNPRFDVEHFHVACIPAAPKRPRTRLIAHVRAGDCVGPGITRPEALENVETGERIPLA